MNKLRQWLPALAAIALILTCAWFMYDMENRMNEWSCDTKDVTVHYGDTVWYIVASNCVGNISRAVDAHVDFYGTNIQNGQKFYLLKNQDCSFSRGPEGDIYEDC
jgi:hypothetical protein